MLEGRVGEDQTGSGTRRSRDQGGELIGGKTQPDHLDPGQGLGAAAEKGEGRGQADFRDA
ncbi:MAG: hypothetical protein IPM73_06595 [Betaproteobacteria bacterium]|nr:hypothetical protein [Betaproteobacteria bacterium]